MQRSFSHVTVSRDSVYLLLKLKDSFVIHVKLKFFSGCTDTKPDGKATFIRTISSAVK